MLARVDFEHIATDKTVQCQNNNFYLLGQQNACEVPDYNSSIEWIGGLQRLVLTILSALIISELVDSKLCQERYLRVEWSGEAKEDTNELIAHIYYS